jgi:protease-4
MRLSVVAQSFPALRLGLACVLAFSIGLGASAQPAPEAVPDAPPADDVAPQRKLVGWLELSDTLRDGPVPFAWMTAEDAGPALQDVLSQVRTVAQGEQYLGLVVYLDQPQLSLTQVGAIADAIGKARAEGRTVIAFAESYDLPAYLVACACDKVLLQHKGGIEMYGLAIEELYLAGLFEKIGLAADLVQIGKYKGADEALTRTGPSEAWNENFDGLLDDLYAQIVARIAEGRRMNEKQAEALIADAWALSDTELIERRVVDRLTDRDLIDVTEVTFGDDFVWDDAMGMAGGAAMPTNPFMLFQMLFQDKQAKTVRPTIAVIHGRGPIHADESTVGDGFFSNDSIGAQTMTRLLGEARDDENIKGVVLRVDSPGGSALASEMIWQAMREVAETKPVYVSIGSMAASGGYYLASAGDQVYIGEPAIVGSIGVVGGKITLGGLYEWAGIRVHRRSRGGSADMFNSVEPFTDGQRAKIRRSMELVYDQFTDRVRRGRGARLADVSKVAQGRLFTGRQAVANGMADKIGGIRLAVTDLAAQLDLEAGQYDVLDLPRPMSLPEFFSDMFGAQARMQPRPVAAGEAGAALATLRRLLGERAWQSVARSLDGLLLLRDEPVLTMMPAAIVIK